MKQVINNLMDFALKIAFVGLTSATILGASPPPHSIPHSSLTPLLSHTPSFSS